MLYRIFRGIVLGFFGGVLLTAIFMYFDGALRITEKHKESDVRIKPYVDKIRSLSTGFMKFDINVGFGISNKKASTVIGTCTLSLIPLKYEIDINPLYWKIATEREKLLLIAHEMRHCLCKEFIHNNEKLSDGCYKSYMSKYTANKQCIKKHYKKYLSEISKGCYVFN